MIGVLNLKESNVESQYEKDSFKYHKYLMKNFKYKGKEIPKDVPYTEYYDYILRNFRNTKPKEEWTDMDYKAYYSFWQRCRIASIIKHEIGKQKEPLTDRQKRIIERVRNGTDFDVYSSQKFLELLS